MDTLLDCMYLIYGENFYGLPKSSRSDEYFCQVRLKITNFTQNHCYMSIRPLLENGHSFGGASLSEVLAAGVLPLIPVLFPLQNVLK